MKNIINRALAAEKKLFTLLLAVAASVGTMFASTKIGDLYYNLDATNQTAEVTSQNSSNPYWSTTITTANIPASVTYNSVSYSVTSIGNYAFGWCTGLTSITIPNSVTSIGNYAFYFCTGLTSIDVASDNSNYCSVDGILFNKDKTTLIQYPGGKQGSYMAIPNSVTSIGEWAFTDCTSLTSVTIPNSVTSIGNYAFWSCKGLTSVTIPNSVTSIGNGAFANCDGLTSPVYNAHVFAYMPTSYSGAYTIPDGIESIAGSAFSKCTGLSSVTIPNSVTSIGDDAFYKCTGLTSLTIGNSVTSIGEWAFFDCTGLTSVTIPNSVTSIGDYAFAGCTGLTSPVYNTHVFAYMPPSYSGAYTIPDGIESIAGGAFLSCSGLTSVTIPGSVTSIGELAFSYCTGMTSVTNFANTPQEITSYVFNNVDKSTCVLYVPAGSVSAYQSADVWKDFTNILPISQQGLEDVQGNNVQCTKVVRDGQIYLLRGDKTYTLTGQEIIVP